MRLICSPNCTSASKNERGHGCVKNNFLKFLVPSIEKLSNKQAIARRRSNDAEDFTNRAFRNRRSVKEGLGGLQATYVDFGCFNPCDGVPARAGIGSPYWGGSAPFPVPAGFQACDSLGKYTPGFSGCHLVCKLGPNGTFYSYYGLGNYQEAVDDFSKAIELDPKNGKAYYNRAIVYGALGRNKDAIEDGTRAIELNPKDANAYINRGIDYIGIGNYGKAVADLNKAIELNAQDAAAYYARGYAHQKLSTFERALPDFRKSAKMGYKKAEAYLRSRAAL